MSYNVGDRVVVNEGAYDGGHLAGQVGTVIEVIPTDDQAKEFYTVSVLLAGGSVEQAYYYPDTCVKLDDESLNWTEGYQAFDARDLSLTTT